MSHALNTTAPTPTHSTLHQLCCGSSHWDAQLTRIYAVWQAHDVLLLLADAAQGYADARLSKFSTVAVLASDAQLLGMTANQTGVRILSNEQWADAVLIHQRCITWR